MKKEKESLSEGNCKKIAPVVDALELLIGKWKMPILLSLSSGDKRYNQIKKELERISDASLARELKELEKNHFINRRVCDTFPISAVYSLTELRLSVKNVIKELNKWGVTNIEKHRAEQATVRQAHRAENKMIIQC